MSKRSERRRSIRWARYINHYGHIPAVLVGGQAGGRIIWKNWYTDMGYLHVRRQAKHRFGEGVSR